MWWPELPPPAARRAAAALLQRCGPVPEHVAFIMDGNRRFAEQNGLKRIEGHVHGYARMRSVLKWCLELGVRVISLYAFSLDNYGRPAAEVDDLMRLAAAKFEELLEDGDASRWGAEVRVIGDLSRAPADIQAAAARLMRGSRARAATPARAIVYICFSYTSSQELSAAVAALADGIVSRALLPSDAEPALLHALLHTGRDCPPVDLLVRTSGEQRLSDFLCWQGSHALLHWEPCLWPRFSYGALMRAILAWQSAAPTLATLRGRAAARLNVAAACLNANASGAVSPHPVSATGGGGGNNWPGRGGAALHHHAPPPPTHEALLLESSARLLEQLEREAARQQQQLLLPPQQQQLEDTDDGGGSSIGGSSTGLAQHSRLWHRRSTTTWPSRWWPVGGFFLGGSGSGGAAAASAAAAPISAFASSSSADALPGWAGGSSSSDWGSSWAGGGSSCGGCCGGSGSSSAASSGAASPVAGRSPERATSSALSVISEEEAMCAPHPLRRLRVDGHISWLEAAAARRLDALAAAT